MSLPPPAFGRGSPSTASPFNARGPTPFVPSPFVAPAAYGQQNFATPTRPAQRPNYGGFTAPYTPGGGPGNYQMQMGGGPVPPQQNPPQYPGRMGNNAPSPLLARPPGMGSQLPYNSPSQPHGRVGGDMGSQQFATPARQPHMQRQDFGDSTYVPRFLCLSLK